MWHACVTRSTRVATKPRERGKHVREGPMKGQFYLQFFYEICKSSNRIICRKADSVWNSKHNRSIIIHNCIGLPHIAMPHAHHDTAVTDMTHFQSLATGPNLQLWNHICNCIKKIIMTDVLWVYPDNWFHQRHISGLVVYISLWVLSVYNSDGRICTVVQTYI